MTDPHRVKSSRCTVCADLVTPATHRRCTRCRALLCQKPSCGVAHEGPCRRYHETTKRARAR